MPSEPPLILAFDTSAAHCAAVVVRGDATLASRDEAMARGQAERLLPLLEEVLADAGSGWGDLAALAVCTGPGNFTGLRLAVAAARGLAMGLDIPAIGVSRFEALAEGIPGVAHVALQDPRGALIVQIFDNGEPLGPPKSGDVEDAPAGAVCLGHDAVQSAAQLGLRAGSEETRADLARLARVAARRLGGPVAPPAPLYIRPADATPASEPPARILDDA